MKYIRTPQEILEGYTTVRYTRVLIKKGVSKVWEHQTYESLNPNPERVVENWNYTAKLQHEQNPENGLWVYILEAK